MPLLAKAASHGQRAPAGCDGSRVQTMVLDIVFVDGGRTQHTEVDLTEALADFNGDMTTAHRVTGTLETYSSAWRKAREITGWEPVDGGDVDAGCKKMKNE